MTSRNRDTLRNFFGEGNLPTSDHFGDLIDSMLNMSDEGFRKSAENGVEVSTPVGHDGLISFYRDQSPKDPRWSMAYGGETDQLQFHAGGVGAVRDQAPAIALQRLADADDAADAAAAGGVRTRVGINTADPQHALDVAGVVAAQGRVGRYRAADAPPVPADGEWHDLTDTLGGCQCFEVVAGAGQPGAGRYALLHAIAMNTYNPAAGWFNLRWLRFLSRRNRIDARHAWYGRRCDQLELRWDGSHGRHAAYRLQVRSKCDYGPGVRIQAHLTKLWFDETMAGSQG